MSSLPRPSNAPGSHRRALLSAALVLAAGLLPPGVHPLAILPALLIGLLLALDLLRCRGEIGSTGASALPLAVACALAGVSAFLALQPLRSVRILITWLLAGLAFASVRSLARREGRRRVLAAVVLVAAVQAAAGIWQATVSFPAAAAALEAAAPGPRAESEIEATRLTAVEARLRSARAVGFLGVPALLASLILLALPPAAAAAMTGRGRRRWGWGAAAVLLLGGLVATRSMGGAAALALAILSCLPWWSGMAAGRRRLLAGLLILAVAAVMAPRIAGGGEDAASRSLALRAGNWQAALSMIAAHPAAGTGPGNFGVAYPAHRPAGANETQHAHSSILEAVSDMGLPILLLLGILLAAFARGIGRGSSAAGLSREARLMSRALAVAALAWVLQSLVDFPAHVAGSVIPFMALAGLAFHRQGAGDDRVRPLAAPAPALVVAALAAALLFSVPDALSRWQLERSLGLAREGRSGEALEAARRAVRWNPWEAEARATLALALLDQPADPGAAGRIREALGEAREAVRLDPFTANRRMTLARARAAAGDGAGAYAAAAMAARLNPSRHGYARERDRLAEILRGGGGSAP